MTHLLPTRVLVTLIFCFGAAWTAAVLGDSNTDTQDVQTVADGNNAFAAHLYGRLAHSETGNLFFSPYSITTALAMTYNGAEGQTATQMSYVLQFTLPLSRLNAAFSALSGELDSNAEVNGTQVYDLALANGLWTQSGFLFNNDFLQTAIQAYGANVQQADFINNAGQAADDINSWVADQTDNLIQDLIPPGDLTARTRLVLVNAIYFKGNWASAFDATLTTDRPFHLNSKHNSTVPLMNQTETLAYTENKQLQIAEFPYVGNTLSMVVLLPRSIGGLGALEKTLTATKLNEWLGQMTDTYVQAYLPKFQMTSQFELANTLGAMGMSVAFTRQANFTGISTEEPLHITHVVHKAFVDVDEVGTTAAAATGVSIGVALVAGQPSVPVEFRADHPFLFLIRDRTTGAILFMGRVTDPS